MSVVGVSLGSGNPGGSGASIAASLLAADVGDIVIVAFGWAASYTTARSLTTVSDTSGNTWTVVGWGTTNETGGYAICRVTTAWADNANTVTGTLGTGTPGGHVWAAMKLPAANVAGTTLADAIDQQNTGSAASTSTPSLATASALAQAAESVVLVSLVRESSAVPSWTSPTPTGAAVIDSATGSGTTSSGVALLEYDNTSGTAAVTEGYTAATAAGNHALALVAIKGAGGTVVSGTGTGAIATSGSASGSSKVAGSGTGGLTTGGSALGAGKGAGTGTGGLQTGGSATGKSKVAGTGTGALTTGGSATGSSSGGKTIGTGTGALTTGGHATGSSKAHGTGTGALTTGGSATGSSSAPIVHGTGTGSLRTGGAATGSSKVKGTGTGALVTSGFATRGGDFPRIITHFDPFDYDPNFL